MPVRSERARERERESGAERLGVCVSEREVGDSERARAVAVVRLAEYRFVSDGIRGEDESTTRLDSTEYFDCLFLRDTSRSQ